MSGFIRSIMLVAILLIGAIPPNFCQLALASSTFISFAPRKSSSVTPGVYVRDTRSRTLFTKYSDLKPVYKSNASGFESEIGAIFKQVAYGSSSTQSPPTSPSTTPSTTPTTTTREPFADHHFHGVVTEPEAFIGKQKEVYPNVPITIEPNVYEAPEKVTSSSDSFSLFTYFVQSENDETSPVVDSFPPPEVPQEERKDVQVRITSVLRKKGYEAIQQEIGRAWAFHVYLTGITFVIVAVVCLFSLSRISTCSNLLPRGYFITLHLMIFLATFLRCLLFLHDPYGAYDRLPSVLTSLLFNSVDPCLTTAYALVLMVLLRAARYRLVPLNLQSPLALAIISGLHIGGSVVVDVSSGVLEDDKIISILNITTQAFTASWGSILCLGYVVSFSHVEKAAQRQQGDLVRLTFNRSNVDNGSLQKNVPRPSLTYAARMFLICTLLHGLLIAFVVLNLVTVTVPVSATSSEAWAWWTQTSLERLIETALCLLLLATAMVLTQTKPRNINTDKDKNVFSIFSNCGRATKGMKNIDVYPVANEKCNILGNGTINNSSLGSSIKYSTNGWKQYHQQSPDHSMKYPMTVNSVDSEFSKITRDDKYDPSILYSPRQLIHSNAMVGSQINPETGLMYSDTVNMEYNQCGGQPVQPHCYSQLNSYSKTLPGNNYYCSQQAITYSTQSTQAARANTIRSSQHAKRNNCNHVLYNTQHHPSNNTHYVLSPADCSNMKYENEYEVAPYYTHSNVSASSQTYSKPYSYYISNGAILQDVHAQNPRAIHKYNKPYRCYESDPRSELSVCSSSQSEIHVDYLTDASSSNDGLNSTLSRSLTLPLHNHPYTVHKSKYCGGANLDNTPDSAVGLDYSPQPGDPKSPEGNGKINLENGANKSLDFLKLSTNSLNEALKGQSRMIGNFVNGVNTDVVGYSPLSLDDSCTLSPSLEYPLRGLKKSTSTGDLSSSDTLHNSSNSPKLCSEVSPPKVTPPKGSFNNWQTNPVTCL